MRDHSPHALRRRRKPRYVCSGHRSVTDPWKDRTAGRRTLSLAFSITHGYGSGPRCSGGELAEVDLGLPGRIVQPRQRHRPSLVLRSASRIGPHRRPVAPVGGRRRTAAAPTRDEASSWGRPPARRAREPDAPPGLAGLPARGPFGAGCVFPRRSGARPPARPVTVRPAQRGGIPGCEPGHRRSSAGPPPGA
jgi:hypothetical protein